MDNVLIDDRRIHVDFSQSVTKLHQDFLRGNPTAFSSNEKASEERKRRKREYDQDKRVKHARR
jgi:peptidyl-prolyl cis-trans isomerase-like 4